MVLFLLLALAVSTRCWNQREVFVGERTFFVDPDCYSRMTRVQRVLAHPGSPVHAHEFENWPGGTRPHTTAPFDYLTAGLAAVLRATGPASADAWTALDRAGAWVSPLLAVLTVAALWFGAGRGRTATVFLFAVSPILVHGTALGRPDHQSLLVLCLAVALRAETELLERPSRGWAVAGGLAWGLGLWVSLYEPLILLALTVLLGAAAGGRAFLYRERGGWAVGLGAVLLLGFAVDGGWTISKPDPAVLAYFANWSRTVGELAHSPVASLGRWTGWLLFPAPFLLIWGAWKVRERRAVFWAGMLLALAGLTIWQARWGYFLALGMAMALPAIFAVFSVFRRSWVAWGLFAVSLWPVAREWDRLLDSRGDALTLERRADNLALYDVAVRLRSAHRLPVMAPWWQSPALAYWSGQPCVAGSSHESLPGTVDAARFYLSSQAEREAEEILAQRRVACVVAYEPSRVEAVCAAILNQPAPKPDNPALGRWLYERQSSPPPFLKLAYANAAFRVYVRPAVVGEESGATRQ